jgi:23S rRNA pseudouridine1911/1915/1917 synthase
LIGDPVYGVPPKGAPDFARYFPRQALHAGFLGFIHPVQKKYMSFEVPLPADMQELLTNFEKMK